MILIWRNHPLLPDILTLSGQARIILFRKVILVLITSISEAKAQPSALIEKVMAEKDVIFGKAGKPVPSLFGMSTLPCVLSVVPFDESFMPLCKRRGTL
jgi:hypothetical protein